MPQSSAARHSRIVVLHAAMLLFAGLALDAHAQIHRCKDENGQTVISDRPCEGNAPGLEPRQGSADRVAARIAAPDMISIRAGQSEAAYAFIPERDPQSAHRDRPATK
ncbi:DUF4124 domain-containing protein [Variovorax sp.]|uniref:DUF4124 domain-containing protein n=1 Tax=Variovorax sp. TaxID=1871043 RepID=UPI002D552D99|nr:DUF4124 domain-containing protein [Variovorax sp.]HYP84541.1 DUF4124 domain-containing protein [Variovorax sp.]